MAIEKERKNNNIVKWFGIIFVIIIIWLVYNPENKKSSSQPILAPSLRIPYEVVREWSIPNGGFGKVIIISTKYRTEKDLRALGDNLKYDTRNERNAFIFVFDNKKASGLYEKIANMNKKKVIFLTNTKSVSILEI